VHKSFDTVGEVLDRFEKIQDQWQDFLPDFNYAPDNGFYAFPSGGRKDKPVWDYTKRTYSLSMPEKAHFTFFQVSHKYFFDFGSPLAPVLKKVATALDQNRKGRLLVRILEDPLKIVMLKCERCGDCAIQHVGFLCPQSGCPKKTRNGPCGGSDNGRCEVRPERHCVWFKAYRRARSIGKAFEMLARPGCVPPRMWELDGTSSWLNFHLKRDHHSSNDEFNQFCQTECVSIELSEKE
jgi:methylenetetrahydrofolate reductase (NADPH)